MNSEVTILKETCKFDKSYCVKEVGNDGLHSHNKYIK